MTNLVSYYVVVSSKCLGVDTSNILLHLSVRFSVFKCEMGVRHVMCCISERYSNISTVVWMMSASSSKEPLGHHFLLQLRSLSGEFLDSTPLEKGVL